MALIGTRGRAVAVLIYSEYSIHVPSSRGGGELAASQSRYKTFKTFQAVFKSKTQTRGVKLQKKRVAQSVRRSVSYTHLTLPTKA